jgi:phosphoadenosine phosphosulfate reductase
LPYCDLYDQGFDRLGCTICPFERNVERAKKRWPRYFKLLEKSFDMLYLKSRACQEHWDNSHQMLSWWLKRDAKYPKSEPIPEQRELFDI